MKPLLRGAAALLIAIASLPAANVLAQDKQVLASERDKDSYMIGMDVAKSLAPAAEDLDLAAFERAVRSEEHTSELQSLMRISYAVFCLKKKKITLANK